MTIKYKRIFVFLGVIVIVLHFLLLFLYPFKPNKFSSFYLYPYFYQDWKLFIPPPDSNYNLYVTYENKGTQTTDVFKELMNKHQSNRLSGSEALLIGLSSSIHHFEKGTDPGKVRNTEADIKFSLVEKFAKNYLEDSRNIHLSHIKLKLVVTLTKSKQTKVYYN